MPRNLKIFSTADIAISVDVLSECVAKSKLENLQFVDYYSESSFQKLLLNIPDNVVPFLVYKSESNIFDEIRREKGRQASDLISRQFLALSDRKINIHEYFYQSQEDELTTLSIDLSKMENDLMELVA